jgi:hypothetical protein
MPWGLARPSSIFDIFAPIKVKLARDNVSAY